MKKSFAFIFVLIISGIMGFSADAQSLYFHDDADELKGTKAYDVSAFMSSNGDTLFIYSDMNNVSINAGRGIFDYDDNGCVSVLVGFYDGKTLVEKCLTKFRVSQQGDGAFTADYLEEGIGKKIIKHLKTKGNVRIIASKYSGSDFDITIPKNPNIKTSIL